MPLSRRDLIRLGLAAPVGLVASRAASSLGTVIARTAPALRPSADGTSATRCALCGSPDHTMLDPGCPGSRRVI